MKKFILLVLIVFFIGCEKAEYTDLLNIRILGYIGDGIYYEVINNNNYPIDAIIEFKAGTKIYKTVCIRYDQNSKNENHIKTEHTPKTATIKVNLCK